MKIWYFWAVCILAVVVKVYAIIPGTGQGSSSSFSKLYNRYKTEPELRGEFENLYLNVQPKSFRIFRSTPNVNDMIEGEIVVVSTGVVNLAVRVDSLIYYAELVRK